jgi:hypothetical protein
MLELRLRSGQIVAFDGRILEVFATTGPAARLHVAQIAVSQTVGADGLTMVDLGDALSVRFAREEAPARARLLLAIEQAQAADASSRLPSAG